MVAINKLKRNFVTFYVKDKYKPILEKFLELIKDDESILELSDKRNPKNILSVSIIEVLHRYNQKRVTELNLKEDETSN